MTEHNMLSTLDTVLMKFLSIPSDFEFQNPTLRAFTTEKRRYRSREFRYEVDAIKGGLPNTV